MGLGKFWPDLNISEAFSLNLKYFCRRVTESRICYYFAFCLVCRSHIFQCLWVQLIKLR